MFRGGVFCALVLALRGRRRNILQDNLFLTRLNGFFACWQSLYHLKFQGASTALLKFQ